MIYLCHCHCHCWIDHLFSVWPTYEIPYMLTSVIDINIQTITSKGEIRLTNGWKHYRSWYQIPVRYLSKLTPFSFGLLLFFLSFLSWTIIWIFNRWTRRRCLMRWLNTWSNCKPKWGWWAASPIWWCPWPPCGSFRCLWWPRWEWVPWTATLLIDWVPLLQFLPWSTTQPHCCL